MMYRAIAALTGAVMLLSAGGPAAALSEDEENRIVALLEHAVDASEGIEIGGATVTSAGGWAMQHDEACEFNRLLNGDHDACSILAILVPPDEIGIDSIYYYSGEDVGHVDMEEWTGDARSEIDNLWDSYVAGTKEQGEILGETIEPLRWVLYPTLNKERGIMTYGILISFDGDETINLIAIKVTRKGYAMMRIITKEQILAESGADLDSVAAYASETYLPATGLDYADFEVGDHVAEIGALGVLAAAMGVNYTNKGWLAAIGAAILIFAKKAWVLLLVVPVALWAGFKKLFRRGS
jgi:uncharacterized membrane-anchored protein